jgi:CheY-like chemotaxis protein
MQILVVEDHEDTREVLTRLCSRCGFNVLSAATLQEGLHFLQASPLDAIISDIALPDGTGYALITEARKRGIKAMAIALSAYTFPEDVQEAKLTGFDYHMSKPFDYAQLQSLLEQRVATITKSNG